MNAEQSIRNLAMLRLGVGVVSWAAPKLGAKLFGLDPDANPQASYLARLFGIRDIALAVGAMQSTGEARRQWLQLGLLCDAADVGAAALGNRGGYLPAPTAMIVGGVAAGATALGAAALRAPDEG
jgi:hypothetical protein